jgi:hypothetical protein
MVAPRRCRDAARSMTTCRLGVQNRTAPSDNTVIHITLDSSSRLRRKPAAEESATNSKTFFSPPVLPPAAIAHRVSEGSYELTSKGKTHHEQKSNFTGDAR